MERKIGEIFEHNGEWYQCVECDSCGKCSLRTTECGNGTKSDLADEVFGECSKIRRSDYKHVIFKKLEKVGEPYFNGQYGEVLQEYKYYIPPITPDLRIHIIKLGIVGIEIKQIKEDMEETKLNIKPFSLEAAKAGKPVCTRDGRKARIICFDRVTNSTNEYTGHLIVLVTNPNGDEQSFYYTEKGNLAGEDEYDNHKWDLMMLPEKKEGWINVYKMKESTFGYITAYFDTEEKAKEDKEQLTGYVATVKINWEE